MRVQHILAIFTSFVLLLYGIHDYLYLPDLSFHAISVHLGHLFQTMIGIHLIPSYFYEYIYDKIDIFSMSSLEFALFWSTMIFISISSIIWYVRLIIYAKEEENKILFNLLSFPLIYISIFIYEFYINPPSHLKEYFLDPFQLDLTVLKKYYNLISQHFHEEVISLLLLTLKLSICWYICLSILYFLFNIVWTRYEKISSSKQQQRDKKERQAWLEEDKRRIVQEQKEYEAEEKRKSLEFQQAKEKAQQEQARSKKANVIIQQNVTRNSKNTKEVIRQDENQDLDDFTSIHDVGENYTSI